MNGQQIAEKNGWLRSFAVKFDGDTANISVVFSWHLKEAILKGAELKDKGFTVRFGGPAARYAGIGSEDLEDAVSLHNPDACRTSKGCPFKCGFCINETIDHKEFTTWVPRRIVIDDNLTACSIKHFDRVVDSLKSLHDIDINQGVSAAMITPHHADRLRELDMKYIRLAWDHVNYESKFMRGWDIIRRAGFPRAKVAVYVLIGFHDTPEDALYRLEMVRRLGGMPFAMRYQPLNTQARNSHVEDPWTDDELRRYARYWNNLRVTGRIPFSEFSNTYHGLPPEQEGREE